MVVDDREAPRINGNQMWLSNVIACRADSTGFIGNHREWWGVNPLVVGSSPVGIFGPPERFWATGPLGASAS